MKAKCPVCLSEFLSQPQQLGALLVCPNCSARFRMSPDFLVNDQEKLLPPSPVIEPTKVTEPINKSRTLGIFGAAVLLVIAVVSVVIALWPDPRLLTSDELIEALRKELGRAHVARNPTASMQGIDALVAKTGYFPHDHENPDAYDERIHVELTDRGVTPTTLRLIGRMPEVREPSLNIRSPLDDEELRLLGEMRHLEVRELYMSRRTVVGLSEIEKLQRLSTLRSLDLRLKLRDMSAEVVAALAKITSLRILVLRLPPDCEEEEAREAYDELKTKIPDCIITISSQNFGISS